MHQSNDVSLQESESDREMNEKSGPTMFCISPPPRRFTKRNTERAKLLPENTKKEISPNTDLKTENTRNECRQEKTAHEESKQLKNVAFCVSPPARKPTKMDTQHIIKKLRNGRMNAVTNTGLQPIKADHATGIHLMDSQGYTDSSSPKHENEKHYGAYDIENEDRFSDNTVERKENQKESMLRMLKMCAENKRNIRKLRDEVAEAKTDIWKCCEEEEQWNCRSDIHKNRVNASLRKIENLKMEKPHLFPKPGERVVTIDEERANLMICRSDLIFHLSQVQEVMQEAIKEKTMERRRLGVIYPKWFLPEFQEEYLKYRKTHGFHRPSLSVCRPVCPAIDIAVFDQKGYNIGQNFKILIDGRQFSYRDLGLTQVMATVHEESCSHGEFGLVFPKTALNKTESRTLFRVPQTTSNIDAKYTCFNDCNNSLMLLKDPHSLMVHKFPNENMHENNVTYLTTLVDKEMIPPFSVARRGSSIPVRMKYLKEQFDIHRFGGSTTHTASLPAARNYLYTIKEAQNEVSETDETTRNLTYSPLYQNQLDRSNSAIGFQEEMINPLDEPIIRSIHDAGKNLKVLDEEKQNLTTSSRAQNRRPVISPETRKIGDSIELLALPGSARDTRKIRWIHTTSSVRTKTDETVKNSTQNLSRIPVPSRGPNKGGNAPKTSRTLVLCRGTKGDKAAGNATLKPSRIPVLIHKNKIYTKAVNPKPSRIPVLCRWTKDQNAGNVAIKPSRIPKLCRAKMDTSKCRTHVKPCKNLDSWNSYNSDFSQNASFSEITSDVGIPYGRHMFVPHPPTQRKPIVYRRNSMFSK